jgi:hypothetical protein
MPELSNFVLLRPFKLSLTTVEQRETKNLDHIHLAQPCLKRNAGEVTEYVSKGLHDAPKRPQCCFTRRDRTCFGGYDQEC